MSLWGGIDYDDVEPENIGRPAESANVKFDLETILHTIQSDPETARQQLQKTLIDAAQNGCDDIIHEILGNPKTKALVDINYQDDSKTTALGYASCFSQENSVAELLRFDANPDLADKNEWTPLMWAVNNNNLGIVKQLLAANADTQIATSSGRTAFDLPMAPDSVTYMYLSANGYISSQQSKPDLGFYDEAVDPIATDMQFNNSLKESAAVLGGFGAFSTISDSDDDLAPKYGDDEFVLAAPLRGTSELLNDFDWGQYKHSSSFIISKQMVPEFLDIVITNYQPSLQKNQYPASANALYMACRYFYYEGNTESFTAFCNPLGRRIELAVQNEQRTGDLAYYSYWLANSEVFLYYIRKDKGINEATLHSLQPVFERLVLVISDAIQQTTHKLLLPLMAPCLLDFDSIPEYGKVEYRDEWKFFRSSSRKKQAEEDDREAITQRHMLPPSYKTLMKNPGPQRVTSVLSSLLLLFQIYGVHSVTQLQIIAKLLYFLTSRIFNRIVRSRRYLNRRRAMQIRLNVSIIEDWCRNNYFRPQSLEVDGKEALRYKSLVDVSGTFLAPLSNILAWLQTFSGFGSDFTNVISTLQELKAVSPKQLLKTATNYRFETQETPLSKDYKHYLQDLASHHERVNANMFSEELPKSRASIEKPISLTKPIKSDSGDKIVTTDGTHSAIPQETPSIIDLDEGKPNVEEASLVDQQHIWSSSSQSCVQLDYELPIAADVEMDEELPLAERIPNYNESDQFWGNPDTSALYESQGARFLIPHVSVDIREQVAKQLEDQDTEAVGHLQIRESEDLAEPADAIGRPGGFDNDESWAGQEDINPVW